MVVSRCDVRTKRTVSDHEYEVLYQTGFSAPSKPQQLQSVPAGGLFSTSSHLLGAGSDQAERCVGSQFCSVVWKHSSKAEKG